MAPALSITKFSRILDISENTARRLITSGKVRASRVGQQWRVLPKDLDLYLAERSNADIQRGTVNSKSEGSGE
jgi:excisionase family DNA binding protein